MLRKTAVLLGFVAGVVGCGDVGETARSAEEARADAHPPVRLAGAGGSFGRAVAASRDVVAVAAIDEAPGTVHVFERSGDRWTLAAMLSAPGASGNDLFGRSLALAPNRLAVGAPWTPGGGAVWVFHRVDGRWTFDAELRSPRASEFEFGRAVAFDGDTLLTGAPTGVDGGRVFLFHRSAAGWALAGELAPSASLGEDAFGTAIATIGGVAVIGAPYTSLGPPGSGLVAVGAAYVFERTDAGWREVELLTEPVLEDSGIFGSSVAIDHGVILVTCNCLDGDAYVYELRDGRWTLVETLQAGWGEIWTGFGHEVAVSNGHAFVTAPFRELPGAEELGVTLRWERTVAGWLPDGELLAPGVEPGRTFGHALAASDDLVVLGAPLESTAEGSAWIFPRGAR